MAEDKRRTEAERVAAMNKATADIKAKRLAREAAKKKAEGK